MNRRILALLPFVLTGASAPAQVSPNTNAAPSSRWLLVVETSRSMQRRSDGAQEVAATLVYNGIGQQMQKGDTLGLWTFNEDLYGGVFPLKEWDPRGNKAIAQDVYEFLKQQKFEKAARLDKVMPDLLRVLKASDYITVALISDGEEKVQGTPFDDQINGVYHQWQSEQDKAHMPFVTLLRASHGKITDWKVNTPPWPMQFPPVPADLVAAREAAAKIVAAAAQPKRTILPPLIVSGRKTNAEPRQPETGADASMIATNAVAPQSTQTPAAMSVDNTAATAPVRIAATPIEEKPAVATTPAIASAPEATAQPAASAAPEAPPAPIGAAVTVPRRSFWGRGVIWIFALVGAGPAVACIFLVARRSHRGQGASLITRSLDDRRK